MASHTREPDVIVSYLTLRRVIGVLGVTLPLLLLLWGLLLSGTIQESISDYYSLRTRDVLVGVLFAISWFLFTYRGYERQDNIAGNLACFFALGVALFPNSGEPWEKVIHFASATGLFLVLAFFCLFLFTKSGGSPTPRKKIRNRIYVICGVTILVCIGLVGVAFLLPEASPAAQIKPVFWLESSVLWAFGISWFVKGETLWRDTPDAKR